LIPQPRGHGDACDIFLGAGAWLCLAVYCHLIELPSTEWGNVTILFVAGLPLWQAKLLADVIASLDWVVTRERVDDEAVRRRRIESDG
jgi:hypothetical protein